MDIEASVVARPYSPTNSDGGCSDYDSDVTPFRSVGSLSPRSPLVRLNETLDLTPNSVASTSPINGTWRDSPVPNRIRSPIVAVASPVAHAVLSPSSKAKYNNRLDRLTRDDRVAIAFNLEEYVDKESKNGSSDIIDTNISMPTIKNLDVDYDSTTNMEKKTKISTRFFQLLAAIMSIWVVSSHWNNKTVNVNNNVINVNENSLKIQSTMPLKVSPSGVIVTGGLGQLTVTTNDFFQVSPKHIKEFQKIDFLTKMNDIAIARAETLSGIKKSQPITIIAKKESITNNIKVAKYSGALTHTWTWEVNNENHSLNQKSNVKVITLNENYHPRTQRPKHEVLGDIFAKTSLHMNLLVNNNNMQPMPIKLVNAVMLKTRRVYQGPMPKMTTSQVLYPGHIEHAMDGPGPRVHIQNKKSSSTSSSSPCSLQLMINKKIESKSEEIKNETQTPLASLFKSTSMHLRAIKHLEVPCKLIDVNIENVPTGRMIQGPLLPFHSKHGHIDHAEADSTMPIVKIIPSNEIPCELVEVELTESNVRANNKKYYQGPMRNPLDSLKNMHGGSIDAFDVNETAVNVNIPTIKI
jgi:hypothetical protein